MLGHTDNIIDICQIKDSEIVSSSWDFSLKIFNFISGKCIRTIKNTLAFRSLTYNSKKDVLICGGEISSLIRIYNTKNWKVVKEFKHN